MRRPTPRPAAGQNPNGCCRTKPYPKFVERSFCSLGHHVTSGIVLMHAGSQTFCLLGNLDEGDEMG
jgi:hypothetical protein